MGGFLVLLDITGLIHQNRLAAAQALHGDTADVGANLIDVLGRNVVAPE